MNYYPFHLGDYTSHTAHLDPLEDLAYRRMLDLYYMREGPLPSDWREIARLIRMRDNGAEIEAVLSEFFNLTDEGWSHARCERELAAYKRMSEGGKVGAAKRWSKGGDAPPYSPPMPTPCPPYAHPISNQNQNQNQEPGTKVEKPRAPRSATPSKPDDVSEQVWSDWCQLRKTKRAPVTSTVIREATIEAEKAGLTLERFLTIWCARGSQGLQADWLKPHERGPRSAPSGEDTNREAMRILGFLDDGVIDA
jgi:uncharacterized protein YdaU (DUF1376 family)